MPAGKDNSSNDGGGGGGGSTNAAGRTTFRPPWVREGPNPLPVPTAPWTLKNTSRRGSNNTEEPPTTLQSKFHNLQYFFVFVLIQLILFCLFVFFLLNKFSTEIKKNHTKFKGDCQSSPREWF